MENRVAELQARIINIHNHLYANSINKTPQGINLEVGKVLHTGMFIEDINKAKIAFSFNSKLLKELRDDEQSIMKFAEYVRNMYVKMNSKWKFYEQDNEIYINDFDLAYTCSQLNNISLSNSEKDIFGDTVEIIRSQWAKQVGGQFFTDSSVTNLAMTLMDFDPLKGDDLVDICAGTGGFLIAGLNHIREIIENKGEKFTEILLVNLAKQSIKGQEIDINVCQIANATLETRLGKQQDPFVKNGDSLKSECFKSNSTISFNSHKCVATNPPFGTKITVKDYKVLREFELAKQFQENENRLFSDKLTYRAPDILFLEQNIKLLVPGEGRLSIVLPYQILSGPQTFFVRSWLLKNTIILSVIDLPIETFQPHTGTKTCLLTLKRRSKPLESIKEVEEYEIFASMPKWIGHDRRGNPIYKKLPNGKNSLEILNDFLEVKNAYIKYKENVEPNRIHSESFVFKSSDIINSQLLQINAQFHKPSKYFTDQNNETNIKWKFVKLEHLTKTIFYPTRFKRDYIEYYDGAVPFFGGSDINQLTTNSGKWLSPNHPKINELKVKRSWLLLTRSGSTGIASIVPDAWDGYAMSEHIIRIVPNEKDISPYYILAFLRSKMCQEVISKGVFGSVIDEIDPSFIAKIDVPIPIDNSILSDIISQVESAEKARNEAIQFTKIYKNEFDSLLGNNFLTT